MPNKYTYTVVIDGTEYEVDDIETHMDVQPLFKRGEVTTEHKELTVEIIGLGEPKE